MAKRQHAPAIDYFALVAGGFASSWLAWRLKLPAILFLLLSGMLAGPVPLALKHFRVDPAVASGPVLTTVTDMCGFFLVLGLATLALPLLV